jgi:hypothetical protein
MLKPKFPNVLLFLFVKYIVFVVLLAFIGDRFKFLVIESSGNTRELISNTGIYALYVLLYTLIATAIFCLPVYFTLKVRNPIYFILLMIAVLVVEYFLYTYMVSAFNLMNGVYNAVIGVLFLLLFFHRHISSIFRQQVA